jgi:hypothetical protein
VSLSTITIPSQYKRSAAVRLQSQTTYTQFSKDLSIGIQITIFKLPKLKQVTKLKKSWVAILLSSRGLYVLTDEEFLDSEQTTMSGDTNKTTQQTAGAETSKKETSATQGEASRSSTSGTASESSKLAQSGTKDKSDPFRSWNSKPSHGNRDENSSSSIESPIDVQSLWGQSDFSRRATPGKVAGRDMTTEQLDSRIDIEDEDCDYSCFHSEKSG